MGGTSRAGGLRIEHPETVRIDGELGGDRRRRSGGAAHEPALNAQEIELKSALKTADLELVDAFTLVAPEETREAGAPAAPPRRGGTPGPTRVQLDLEADQYAVLLLERDGVFTWRLPAQAIAHGRRRRSGKTTDGREQRTVVFDLDAPLAPAAKGRRRRGPVRDFLFGRLRAVVLRFTAKALTRITTAQLEKDLHESLVWIGARDPGEWRACAPEEVQVRADDRPRALLLVHGTFSSTRGSFRALATTDEGRALLDRALALYSVVLGFDHKTLSLRPDENAAALIGHLAAVPWPKRPAVDVVCFSRGGLVTRSFLRGLSASGFQADVERAVFVGCTNGGTKLADPENWHRLIDLYTNLGLAACKLGGLFAATAIPAAVLSEVLEGVSKLVKYLAVEAVTEGGVPGLAAMQPGGEFLRSLAQPLAGAANPECRVVASSFDLAWGRANVEDGATSLTRELMLHLADGFSDQLMATANDLVVHTESMSALGENPVVERLALGQSERVHHLCYFATAAVARRLAEWLTPDGPSGSDGTGAR